MYFKAGETRPYILNKYVQYGKILAVNEELADTYEKLEQAYLESIQTLRYTVEAKDTYTRGHSDRVSEYSVLLGKKMGFRTI